MQYRIIEAGLEWSDSYREFCRLAYLAYYPRPSDQITEDLFSPEIFSNARIKAYYDDLFIGESRRVWLALDAHRRILGGIAASRSTDICELKVFYVAPVHKGKGIGHALYKQAEQFADGCEIRLDVVNYMTDTIEMYKHWGYVIDNSRGYILYPWDHWSDAARHAGRGIFMVKSAAQAG